MSETPRPAARPGWIDWLEHRLNLTEIFSFVSHFGLIYTPVDTARPLRQVLAELGRQPVPAFARGARSLGLLAAILFGLQGLTGILLAYYYRPTPDAAFDSTRLIVRDVPFGWLLHQVHAWGARVLIAVVVARLLRLFWDGLYRAPREVLWLSASAIVYLVANADFSGRLLTWDAHSYWTTVRGMETIRALPGLGWVLGFFVGGGVVHEDLLLRFYVFHILVLPALISVFLYLTIATIRRVGLSPPSPMAPASTTTVRDHLFGMLIVTLLLFGLLVTLAVLLPMPFLSPADPYSTPGGIGPAWYLLAPWLLMQKLPGPAWLWGFVSLVAGLAVMFLPWWLKTSGDPGERRRAQLTGAAVFGLWVVLTVLGAWVARG
jgi:quinol-cytochrome oxidoreductase complex cytochrome b subunit